MNETEEFFSNQIMQRVFQPESFADSFGGLTLINPDLVEFMLAVLVCSVNSVDDQAVKVWREIQRIAAALHERHGPALRQLQPQEFPGAAAKSAKDDSDENIQDIAQQTGVVGPGGSATQMESKAPTAGQGQSGRRGRRDARPSPPFVFLVISRCGKRDSTRSATVRLS